MAQNVVIDLSSMKATNDVTLQKEDNTTTTKISPNSSSENLQSSTPDTTQQLDRYRGQRSQATRG